MTTNEVLSQSHGIETVAISDIDSEDKTYQITTKRSLSDLTGSITQVGLISPPILKHVNSKNIIIGGFRRVAAFRELGLRLIKARVIDQDADEIEYIKIAIADNSMQRPLNLIEQSRSIKMLWPFKDTINLARTASMLGLPEGEPYIKKIRKICDLIPMIQKSVIEGSISMPVALELGRLKRDEGVIFSKLFNDLKLGTNKQREILTFVKEISLREDVPIRKILEQDRLGEILNDEEIERNQKVSEIIKRLKNRRFPALTKAEDEFEKHVKKLGLNNHLKLTPPNSFEGNTFSLNIRFKNLKDLEDRKTDFDKVVKGSSIKKILHRG
jgi:ParB family chromosome partitioning protein